MNTRKLRIFSVLLALFLLIQGIPVTAQAADDNILIYYNFDGNVKDSSGNENDGSTGGTVAYEAGYSGEAVRLNGSGWVRLPQNMILNNTSFTISMRFKTSGSGGLFGYQNADVGTGEGVCTEYVPVLSVRSDGKLYAEMWTGSSMTVTSTQIVNDNEWHRVVMTSGTNSIRVYLDGVDIGGATGTPQHLSMNINQVGTNAGWGRTGLPPAFTWNGFTGLIDDFTFYSNAQSASEIAKQTQTISFDALPAKTLGSAQFELTATASSGLSVTYTSSNSAVATISGSTVTLHGVGTTEIAANQSGNGTYSAAPQVVRTLYVIDTPQVTTSAPSTITANLAALGGNVTSDGGDTVTGRGVVYSSTDNTPTIGESGVTQVANGSGTGSFSESIGSLTPSTRYYVCAYATNSAGTSYGSVMEFTTSAPPAEEPHIALGSPMLTGETYYYPNASVSGENIRTILISFSDSVTEGDEIILPATTPEGFTVSASSASNDYTKRINLDAGVAESAVQEYIRGIGFAIASATQSIKITVTTENITYDTYYNIDTEHYYQYIPDTTSTWIQAYDAVKAMSYMGRTGYLATIMSQDEDEYVNSLSGGKTGWLGGTILANTGATDGSLYYDGFNTSSVVSTGWYWACGPERGTTFYNANTLYDGADPDAADAAAKDAESTLTYYNWARGQISYEPNNQTAYVSSSNGAYETCLTTLAVTDAGRTNYGKYGTTFSWNDKHYSAAGSGIWDAKGYFVEYGNLTLGDNGSASTAFASDSATLTGTAAITTPNANIDYASGKLTGLTPNASYKITVDGLTSTVTASAEGTIDATGFYGKTIFIVSPGNGSTTTDSEAQTIAVSAKPAVPQASAFDVTNPASIEDTTAEISGITSAYEYSTDGGNTWIIGNGSDVIVTAGNSILIRVKATDDAPASDPLIVNVTDNRSQPHSSGGSSAHSVPKVTTTSVSGVTASGAALAGRVVSTGGALVTERGFILSTSPNPVLGAGDPIIIPAGGGTGSFTAAADSLLPATTYYTRVYAVSTAGTSYGATLSFTTGYIGDGTSAIPKTGDDAAPWPFLLCGAAIATAVGLVVLRRRERRG